MRKKVNMALELVRKLVLSWNPDFTKVTPAERAPLMRRRGNSTRGNGSHDAINWD